MKAFKHIFILLLLTACGDATLSTGGSVNLERQHPRVDEALALMANRHPQGRAYVNRYITSIVTVESNRSYVNIHTGVMYLTREDIRESTLPWLASSIIHDAYHVEQQHECSQANELDAYNYQLSALKQLGGSDYELQYLRELPGTEQCTPITH